ncbi:MAG: pyridoxal phosphate-dependent aminotransferase family protein [Tepidisphaera sp.]
MPRIGFDSWDGAVAEIDGKPRVVFGGCNYLGLAQHPDVHAAIVRGLARWGVTTTASRETTGNTRAHESLERELAAFLRMPAAILTTEGYTANIALGQGLVGEFTVAVVDEKSHSSVVFGMGAPGLRVVTYKHLDAVDAVRIARRERGAGESVVVMSDGVFAAGGSVAPAGEILAGLPEDVPLILDDCHGFTVLGECGRGTASHFGILGDPRLILTTTLGKGLGSYGGAVLGPAGLISRVRERALVYRGTTPCPPPLIEGSREALKVIVREPGHLASLRKNVAHMKRALAEAIGWKPVQEPSTVRGVESEPLVPIFVFHLPTAGEMERVQKRLDDAGYFVPLIDYPGGPVPLYFRPTVTSSHTAAQIDGFAAALKASICGPSSKADAEAFGIST